ncbi:MAG: hypothetical protein KTV68_08650 [Acidimicrobiia bacterium]|nr:hypothetical protein [Acidimicrobiia bacterium]MCY4434436.1 hypothetical protein [bacterium]
MNSTRTYTDSSGFERLLGNFEAFCGWLVVAAHVVERRHNEHPIFTHDFKLACGLYGAVMGEHRMGDVLNAHLSLGRQQLAARYDVDHPLTFGRQGIECCAGNLDRREADSASCLQLQLKLRRQAVVVRG